MSTGGVGLLGKYAFSRICTYIYSRICIFEIITINNKINSTSKYSPMYIFALEIFCQQLCCAYQYKCNFDLGGPNFQGPNLPGPNLPGPNLPLKDFPGPILPGPNLTQRITWGPICRDQNPWHERQSKQHRDPEFCPRIQGEIKTRSIPRFVVVLWRQVLFSKAITSPHRFRTQSISKIRYRTIINNMQKRQLMKSAIVGQQNCRRPQQQQCLEVDLSGNNSLRFCLFVCFCFCFVLLFFVCFDVCLNNWKKNNRQRNNSALPSFVFVCLLFFFLYIFCFV